MALVPKTFENPDDTTTAVADKPTQAAAPVQAAQAAPAQTAVATRPATAVAVQRSTVNPFSDLENAYKVDYNTLVQVQATNGNFVIKESMKPLGDEIGFEIISYQKNFVIDPGIDGELGKKMVRFSSDGITIDRDGMACADYLQELLQTYPKAKKTERVILVGAITACAKAPEVVDTLVQIDLPPSSKALFDRYTIQSAFSVSRGKMSREDALRTVMRAKITKNAQNNIYTLVEIETAKAA